MISPQKTQAISKITYPSSKKAMHSFLGKNNFVRRFIPSFFEIIRPLQNMIKKDANFSWGNNEKELFKIIIEAISEAPSLLSPEGASDIASTILLNDYFSLLPQLKFASFIIMFCRGRIILEKLGINLVTKLIFPKKDCIAFLLEG